MDKEKHDVAQIESFVKVDTDQNKVPFASFELPSLEKLPVLTTDFLLTSLLNGNTSLQNTTHSPPLPDNNIYLENNVFRI